ncbi:MAG: redoxin domain-containing protein [Planctomycetota bacterium]
MLLRSTLLLTLAAVFAPQDDEVPEGHSFHGDAFNEGPRQAAYLMPNNGSVRFPVATEDEYVQAMFNQAVGQLHGFWYFEAERSFRQVAALEPDCAAAYWGMAMANVDNDERAATFAREAWLRREQATERVQLYIDAWARYYSADYPEEVEEPDEDDAASLAPTSERKRRGVGEGNGRGNGKGDGRGPGTDTREAPDPPAAKKDDDKKKDEAPEEPYDKRDNKAKRGDLVQDIEAIVRAYPEDIEAKAFLVNQLWMNSWRGLPISSRQANQALLDEIFDVEPNHPSHHYRIHLWDRDETSEYAVSAAVNSGPSWPTVAHQWHMGGHIFENLGRHADAAWQQEAAARVDHAHMMRDRVLPDRIHNFAHNNEWLVRSLGHCGRVDEALDLARNMIELPRHPAWNGPSERGSSAWWGRKRLLGTLALFERWEELIAACDSPYLGESGEPDDDAERAFQLAQAYFFLGDDEGWRAQEERLQALLADAKLARAEALDEAEEEALAEEDAKDEDVKKAMRSTLDAETRKVNSVRDRLDMLAALDRVLEDEDADAALAELKDLGFSTVLRARLLAEAGLHEEATELARETVEGRNGQAVPLATLAYVLWLADERDDALERFAELRAISSGFDLDVPAFARLAPLAAAAGAPADWRVPYVAPDDVASRVDLDTLGPRRWSPPPAPGWSCPDSRGIEHTLSDTTGRPRILILFLGFGCAHCVEQLEAFGPAAGDFAAAGIELIAIGDDPADEISRYDGVELPFPVLADPAHEVFRDYRCFDDFEDMPLHGTFLIDGDDRVRWQDVSYEPFTDTEFLLEEAQRLLSLGAAQGVAEADGETGDDAPPAGAGG